MESFHFRIADISIQMNVCFPLKMTEHYEPFLTAASEMPDEKITVSLTDSLQDMPEPASWSRGKGKIARDGREAFLYRLGDGKPYLMEVVNTTAERECLYATETNEQPDTIVKVFNNLGFENLLFRHQALILHCSFVRWNGRGILFSAPSGTGKSTQADLWEKFCGSETINGDRAGLRKIDNTWRAYGLPFAGSSGIYRNESAPISAIVLLEQGPSNQIYSMTPAQALRKLLPELTLHHWEPAFMDRALDLVLDLLGRVPAYHLVCRPNREAVELLKETITQEV